MFAKAPFHHAAASPAIFTASFHSAAQKPSPKTIHSNQFADLARIYEDDVNLCLIQRPYPSAIEQFVNSALRTCNKLEINHAVAPENFDFNQLWPKASRSAGYQHWLEDVALLTSAFCDLFEMKEAGLRLYTLDKAMCPRFHVDRVPARMICSYGGIGTEWLPEYALDRSKLGIGGCGLPDDQSGLIIDSTAIRQMPAYAVGLMKGENWEGNEGKGLAHRSPAPTAVQPRRLLMTLDML